MEKVLRSQVVKLLEEAGLEQVKELLEIPPRPELGDLAFPCFDLARRLRKPPSQLAEQIARKIRIPSRAWVARVEAQAGYVNFFFDWPRVAEAVLRQVSTGVKVDVGRGQRVLVEYVSVNPIHPLHIGSLRNACIGNSLVRILRATGHEVISHFYVNDMGLQAAVLVFGYLCMPDKRPDEKADHWFGKIYAITDRFIERDEEVLAELKTKWPGVFNRLVPILQHKERVREQVRELMAKCEAGDPRVMRKFRQVARLCLAGFKTTLSQLGISFDSYDFESDFVLDGSVYRVVERLKRRGALKQSPEKTWFLDLEELNLPSLVLVRSDGTTLYVTRDVAYSMWKFRECEVQRVINVIGKEQSLAQAQVRAALSLLGHEQWANSLTHYAYEHVRFPGVTISGRRGRYLTIDELIQEAVRRAEGEVMKRAPGLSEGARRKTSRAIALGAIKYAILRVEPAKLITFDLDRALSFEGDTGPYIQYAHTRCCGILRKARRWTPRYKVQTLTNHEKVLIRLLGRFSQVVEDAARELSPHQVCAYAFDLATAFSTFYQFCPVLRAKPPSLRNFRLTLVKAVQTVLRDVCDLMGIEAPHRM